MDGYLISATAQQRHEELLREAAQARLAASVRRPHPWRRTVGRGLIRLGQALTAEPAPARRRARVA
jgi:hypothetical protein